LFLNNLQSVKRSRLLAKIHLEQFTKNTLTDIDKLKRELKRLAPQDIGVDNEEFMQGMVAVAVPLRSEEGAFYGALAMHAPSARMSLNDAISHIPKLKIAAVDLVELIQE
jgi:DNA-binding IclR family transcriptional regulator